MKDDMGFFDVSGDGLSFDQTQDRVSESHDETVSGSGQDAPKPTKKAVKRAGSRSGKRIAGPGSGGDPMQDNVVVNELGQPLPSDNDIVFPYEATVITEQNPLRIRESASLTAKVLGRMPRGRAVLVTGPTVNHFRPVLYKDGDKPQIEGWSFTAYLSPPWRGASRTIEPIVEKPTSNEDVARTREETHVHIDLAPEIKSDGTSIAGKVTADMKKLNAAAPGLETGLHYKDRYREALERAGRGGEWRPNWQEGHTASDAWHQPYQNNEVMTWSLKSGRSASEALRQWLSGLTIADCASARVAIELDAVRAAIGDKVFDRCFGSTAGNGVLQQLTISQRIGETPLYSLMRYTDTATTPKNGGTVVKRPVQVGEWYYFRNVPDYLLKHPAGAWQGENALYLGEQNGKQMWSGLGVTSDEEGLMRVLVEEYNKARSKRDFDYLVRHFNSPMYWPREYKEGFAANDPDEHPVRNEGPRDVLKLEDVLAGQAATMDATDKRAPSGFAAASGVVLSSAKLIELTMKYGGRDKNAYQPPPSRRDDGSRLA
jgi:hypothetical protein